MKHVVIKLITGEELLGTTESEFNDDVINLDNPFRLMYGYDENGNYGLRVSGFMTYCDETLFTFNSKHIILYSYPASDLVAYYEDLLRKREKLLLRTSDFDNHEDEDEYGEDIEPQSRSYH